MNNILGIINTGLGYIDDGLNLYNTHFGGSSGSSGSTPPYATLPYVPPTASNSNGSTGSNTNTIAGISVTTLALIAVAFLILKK